MSVGKANLSVLMFPRRSIFWLTTLSFCLAIGVAPAFPVGTCDDCEFGYALPLGDVRLEVALSGLSGSPETEICTKHGKPKCQRGINDKHREIGSSSSLTYVSGFQKSISAPSKCASNAKQGDPQYELTNGKPHEARGAHEDRFATSKERAADRVGILVRSSIDASWQPSLVILPPNWHAPVMNHGRRGRPLLVSLHTWSGDWTQQNAPLEAAAEQLGWFYLAPNFRGSNQTPSACGSIVAQQDIVDAISWCLEHYPIDPTRIYLTGVSGGGHMTMMMAGRYPDLFAAASAWVGISDLESWHELHVSRSSRYDKMLEACCGGPPGASVEVDREYRDRSPINWLHQAKELPLDIAAGVHDGHDGSVPVEHSLRAFNVVAQALDKQPITEVEIDAWMTHEALQAESTTPKFDAGWGRKIWFRRQVGVCRVTLFEGGHEGLAPAAIEWLSRYARDSVHRELWRNAIVPYIDLH